MSRKRLYLSKSKIMTETRGFTLGNKPSSKVKAWDFEDLRTVYTASVKGLPDIQLEYSDLLDWKESIEGMIEVADYSDKFNISISKGAEIERVNKNDSLCSDCSLIGTEDCVDCVFEMDSPLERILFKAMKEEGIHFRSQYGVDYFGKNIYTKDKSYNDPENNFKDVLTIADFFIKTEWGEKDIFLYVDGHTYHERTEKQATKDKKIDRKLQELDFVVYRFTGKEVRENIAGVVKDIKKALKPKSKRK